MKHSNLVRMMKIDTYLELFPDHAPKLVKIDVEGFERQVLEGMKNLLKASNAPCLIVEVCEGTHVNDEDGVDQLVGYLKTFGYQLFSSDINGNLKPFTIGATLNCIGLRNNGMNRLYEKGISVDLG